MFTVDCRAIIHTSNYYEIGIKNLPTQKETQTNNNYYEKRDILFVQKTWKDFESSLHKHFLQDRYDAYIRESDIVLFLFHTRLGQYTLRELEVANEVNSEQNRKLYSHTNHILSCSYRPT